MDPAKHPALVKRIKERESADVDDVEARGRPAQWSEDTTPTPIRQTNRSWDENLVMHLLVATNTTMDISVQVFSADDTQRVNDLCDAINQQPDAEMHAEVHTITFRRTPSTSYCMTIGGFAYMEPGVYESLPKRPLVEPQPDDTIGERWQCLLGGVFPVVVEKTPVGVTVMPVRSRSK